MLPPTQVAVGLVERVLCDLFVGVYAAAALAVAAADVVLPMLASHGILLPYMACAVAAASSVLVERPAVEVTRHPLLRVVGDPAAGVAVPAVELVLLREVDAPAGHLEGVVGLAVVQRPAPGATAHVPRIHRPPSVCRRPRLVA